MRRPLRKTLLWFGLALLGAAMVAFLAAHDGALDETVTLILGIGASLAVPAGLVFGLSSLLSALGEARLRSGSGVLARWQVTPADWERFRAFDTRRTAEDGAQANDYTPRPAAGRPVEVLFGQRQVIVDGSYHRLGRWSLPELRGIGWLLPPDAPECIEFDLAYPRGRHGGTVPIALRIPVPRVVRDEGVRVFRHFKASVPEPRVGLAFRRPGLVIGWGLGLTAAALLAAGIGWLLHRAGDDSLTVMLLLLGGLISAIGAAIFTLIIVLATAPWKRRGR